MLRGVLEAQAPPKQTATETIDKYGDRLANATLLEDRRTAIQGLRSLAKEYPASVASKSLRDLISTLTRDSDDVETAQIVLEALLALFNPNEGSPEASDDIALWLADEFSQRQDNVTALLTLLEKGDFYSTLHSLQLLSAISSARPDRTQECILSAPLGTARLVGVLDDSREAIRSAGLLLLNDVTQSSQELQKLVAFENAFERIFNLIQAEGSIIYGGIIVQDCLSILANLLHLNGSNQSLFRESGLVPRLCELLSAKDAEDDDEHESGRPNTTRDRNLWGVLALLRMFVVEGSKGTQASQIAFEKQGVLHLVLLLGFDTSVGLPIRAEALKTCADIIRANATIQERFGHNEVPWTAPNEVNGNSAKHINGDSSIHIVDGLLALTLTASPSSAFDLRLAACECLEAYFFGHNTIRLHFLGHAIHLHNLNQDNDSNILSILVGGPRAYDSGDPYRIWFAGILAYRLIEDDSDAKKRVMDVAEGDAEKGEEVVTCIQAVTGNLVYSLDSAEDERVCIGYLVLLCGWLFDSAEAVNDFLSEGSSLQSLLQAVGKNGKASEITQGLCVFLLGTLYEFSTKDSPVPRRRIQEIILSGLGRDHYVQRLSRLRAHQTVRDFEVLPQDLTSADTPGAQPNVFYDPHFVDFMKDNFSRLVRAIDRDPNLEVSGTDKAVDRNLVDDIRRLESELQENVTKLKKAQERETELDADVKTQLFRLKKAEDKEQDLRNEIKAGKEQVDGLQKTEAELRKTQGSQEQRLKAAESKHGEFQTLLRDHQTRLQKVQHEEENARASVRALEEQMGAAKLTQSNLQSTNQDLTSRMEKARETENNLQASVKDRSARLKDAQQTLKDAQQTLKDAQQTHMELEATIRDRDAQLKQSKQKQSELAGDLKKKEDERKAAQTELDDMLIKNLKELGASVSEGEDDVADEDEAEDADDGDEHEEGGSKTTTEEDVD
ncbi:MAG: hypothetical protein M1828_002584 [Chrysothrix sp. TS-e1954]|nr:MAG: hypothetical protein M1828_002584 [Chrysothrix sp. TS-e1954]